MYFNLAYWFCNQSAYFFMTPLAQRLALWVLDRKVPGLILGTISCNLVFFLVFRMWFIANFIALGFIVQKISLYETGLLVCLSGTFIAKSLKHNLRHVYVCVFRNMSFKKVQNLFIRTKNIWMALFSQND